MRRTAWSLSGILALAMGPAATAATVQTPGSVGPFGPALPIATHVAEQDVALEPGGGLLLAWAGTTHTDGSPPTGFEGVSVAERRAGALTATTQALTPPGDGVNRAGVRVAAGADGTRAVLFTQEGGSLWLAVARPGAGFGPAGALPLVDPAGGAPAQLAGAVDVAVSPDGTATVIWSQGGEGTTGTWARVLDAAGGLGPAQRLGTSLPTGPPSLATSATGEVLAVYDTQFDAAGPTHVLVARRAPRADGFSTVDDVDAPGLTFVNFSGPVLQVNARGEGIVAFGVTSRPGGFPFPEQTVASTRGADGRFGPARAIASAPAQLRFGLGLGPAGDALAVLPSTMSLSAVFRPAGGDFGAPTSDEAGPRDLNRDPQVGVDRTGGAVAILADTQRSPQRVEAYLRPPSGPLGPPLELGLARTSPGGPSLATDGDGNGIVAWTAFRTGQPATLVARVLSRSAPVVRPDAATTATLPLTLSEPATVTVEVLSAPGAPDARAAQAGVRPAAGPPSASAAGARRVATVRVVLPAGRSRVALPTQVRRARGRLVARVGATDGGPRRRAPVTIALRRP